MSHAIATLADTRPIIRLDGVGMRFGGQQVLRDVHLDIQRGQTVCVIGESGCGKTVFLKLIVGLLMPSSGRVLFDGQALVHLDERALTQLRLRCGFLFQGAALFDSMTVFENVAFALREHTKKSEEEVKGEVRQRLQEVGLPKGVDHKKPAELSGGMKKRVGLARAIILNPELMLYDEPTTGLDPVMSEVIDDLILQMKIRRPGLTSIVVTHDLRTVQRVADRVLMLFPLARLGPNDPQVVFDGTLQELNEATDPRVQRFVGKPAEPRP